MYMLMSHHQNAGKRQNTKIGNRSFETVANFQYLCKTVSDQNLTQEQKKGEIEFR
jgi:hypothetical protein